MVSGDIEDFGASSNRVKIHEGNNDLQGGEQRVIYGSSVRLYPRADREETSRPLPLPTWGSGYTGIPKHIPWKTFYVEDFLLVAGREKLGWNRRTQGLGYPARLLYPTPYIRRTLSTLYPHPYQGAGEFWHRYGRLRYDVLYTALFSPHARSCLAHNKLRFHMF